jgi:hypothetical protein
MEAETAWQYRNKGNSLSSCDLALEKRKKVTFLISCYQRH